MKRILFLAAALFLAVSTILVTAIPAAACDSRWTGGGTINSGAIKPPGVRVTHGFEFHTDLDEPNNLEVNWGGNRFHLTELLFAASWYNPIEPGPEHPIVEANFAVGTGQGKYNGTAGYWVIFKFTDGGEPGVKDWAWIVVTDKDPGENIDGIPRATLNVIMEVKGFLKSGNHQAHPDNK